MSVRSTPAIFEELRRVAGFSFLLPARLNQDDLESFSSIRPCFGVSVILCVFLCSVFGLFVFDDGDMCPSHLSEYLPRVIRPPILQKEVMVMVSSPCTFLPFPRTLNFLQRGYTGVLVKIWKSMTCPARKDQI